MIFCECFVSVNKQLRNLNNGANPLGVLIIYVGLQHRVRCLRLNDAASSEDKRAAIRFDL